MNGLLFPFHMKFRLLPLVGKHDRTRFDFINTIFFRAISGTDSRTIPAISQVYNVTSFHLYSSICVRSHMLAELFATFILSDICNY